MKDLVLKTCRIALVQAAPIVFDKEQTAAKSVQAIAEAAARGAELIVFPESYIPCYPYGMTFGFTVGTRPAPKHRECPPCPALASALKQKPAHMKGIAA